MNFTLYEKLFEKCFVLYYIINLVYELGSTFFNEPSVNEMLSSFIWTHLCGAFNKLEESLKVSGT